MNPCLASCRTIVSPVRELRRGQQRIRKFKMLALALFLPAKSEQCGARKKSFARRDMDKTSASDTLGALAEVPSPMGCHLV